MCRALIVLALLLLPTAGWCQPPGAPNIPVVIQNVTVIDGAHAEPLRDRGVVVSGGRIVEIASSRRVRVPAGARVVDGRGKYLIPGLWEMHAHVTGNPNFSDLYVVNGVTGIRDMGSSLPALKAERKAIAAGEKLGPKIVAAGPVLDTGASGAISQSVRTDEEARETVRKLKAEGVDFIKIGTMLPGHLYEALAAAAKAEGLPFAGHVPLAVSARDASDRGQISVEHLMGISIACSTQEEELLTRAHAALGAIAQAFKDPAKPDFALFNKQMQILFVEIPTELEATYSQAKAAALFKKFAKNRTWQCPTLVALHHLGHLREPGFFDDARMKYLSPGLRAFWMPGTDPRFVNSTPEGDAGQRALFPKLMERTLQMHRAGVPILAGSDVMNPRVFPGFSLHEELEFLVQAGLTPREALQAATRNPARFLGLEKTHGTIEKGKVADLVLLDADPLADIRNTRQISGVILQGRLLERAELDAILSRVEAAARREK